MKSHSILANMLVAVTILRPMKLLALALVCFILTLEDPTAAAVPPGMECAAEVIATLKSAAADKADCTALHAHCVHSDNKAKLKMTEIRCAKSLHGGHDELIGPNLLETMLNNCKSHLTRKASEPTKALIELLESKQPHAVKVLNTICTVYKKNPLFVFENPASASNEEYIPDAKETIKRTSPSQGSGPLLVDLGRNLDHSVPRLEPNVEELANSIAGEANSYVFNGFCPSTDQEYKKTYTSDVMVADCPNQSKPEEVKLMCNNDQKKPKIVLKELLERFQQGNPLADMTKAKEKMTTMLCNCQAVKKPASWKKAEVMTKFVTALKSC